MSDYLRITNDDEDSFVVTQPTFVICDTPDYKWKCAVFPSSPDTIEIQLEERLHWWHRFWTWLFFGWRWKQI